MITEASYCRKVSINHRKKYAQFFTPEDISDFMVEWLLDGMNDEAKMLEPAYGLGVFSRSILRKGKKMAINGYDIDDTILEYAKSNLQGTDYNVNLIKENYILSPWSDMYDGIICNPPYLKFHDYDNARLVQTVNEKLNIHLNGFTNIYSLFLLKSISQLKEGGRLAYIVPSEFMNSDYGVEVKRTLLGSGTLRHVITVDFTQCAFDDALTTACIIFCEKSETGYMPRFSKVNNVEELKLALTNYSSYNPAELSPEVKWKQYYGVTESQKYNHLVPFSTFAKVSRGIATGANNYFTFNSSRISLYNIPPSCLIPCICHSIDVRNLVFTKEDFKRLVNSDKTVYLFNGTANENDENVREYINLGIANDINKRYLTSCRTPWYSIENRKPSPIWVSVFNRSGLRFVRNKAGVHNLTTFHCVYINDVVDTDILFAYLITDMAKEIFLDNSRQYGNGLIKFEPNDFNRGNVADLRLLTEEERAFVLKVYEKLNLHTGKDKYYIELLDDLFRHKYSCGGIDIQSYYSKLSTACP